MSDDRFDNTSGARGSGDKGNYEDLYNDLPKEVVDILMQTHPLISKGENGAREATRYPGRTPSREDVEEIKEARMQQVSSEISEIRRGPQQEGEPTRYVSRRARHSEEEEEERMAQQDEYDDGIQYVSVMPARKKSKRAGEVSMQTNPPARRKRAAREEQPFADFENEGRPRYESLDFEERAKQEHLDNLYDDEYDDYEDRGRSKLGIILGIVALAVIVFLIFRSVSLSSQLEEAQNQITTNADINSKYETLQLEKMQLEEELARLKNPDGIQGGEEEGEGAGGTGNEPNTGTNTTTPPTATGAGEDYTVAAGDTFWSIAQKVYGNGAEFKKILDANGLKESDTLRVGQKLKVPQ